MPWGVLLYERQAFPPACSPAQLLPFLLPSLQCCLLLSRPLCHRVFFSFSWPSGSEPGFVQQLALSEVHSSTKRGSRQEHLSANSHFKGSPNSTEKRTDRHFLADEVGETLASNLQWVIYTTETNLEGWKDCFLYEIFPVFRQNSNLDLSGYTPELCRLCPTVSSKLNLRSAPFLTTCRRQWTSKIYRFTCSQRWMG